MTELGALVGPLTLAFAASIIGAIAALLVRAVTGRHGRQPSLLEATWCAFLPVASTLLVPVAAGALPHAGPPYDPIHEVWHRVEVALHNSGPGHTALHAANWLVLAAGGSLLCRAVFALSRMCCLENAVRRSARDRCAEGAWLLPTARPLCFTLGFWSPRVYLSEALRTELSGPELRAVLAHEEAHVRRRDTLTMGMLSLYYSLLPVPGARLLLRDWRRAAERACDAAAAAEVGSTRVVATALVRVARLMAAGAPAGPPQLAFRSGIADWYEDLEGRVLALLPGERPDRPLERRRQAALACGSLAFVLTSSFWLAHAVELFAHH